MQIPALTLDQFRGLVNNPVAGLYRFPAREDRIATDWISQSNLKEILKTPADYAHRLANPLKETESMRRGSAVHCALLEGVDVCEERFIQEKKFPRTKIGSVEAGLWKEAKAGKTVLKSNDFSAVYGMFKACNENSQFTKLLSCSVNEVSFLYQVSDMWLTGTIDLVIEKAQCLGDFKTTSNADTISFTQSVQNYGYHFQAAYYLDAYNAITGSTYSRFVMPVVESSPPYKTRLFSLSEATIDKGRELYLSALQTLSECTATGIWPGYGPNIEEI